MSIEHGLLSRSQFPELVSYRILSYLPVQELGRAQMVCTEWRLLAGNDLLWRELYGYIFKKKAPESINIKESFLIERATKLDREDELGDVMFAFICNLQWEKKRRLICSFSDKSFPPMIIEHSFGPKRGTKDGAAGSADETEYYHCTADDLDQISAANPVYERIDENGLPGLPDYPKKVGFPAYTKGTMPKRMFEKFDGGSYGGFIPINTEGVDVGYGNTLGFYSDINDWKVPFKLICRANESGLPVWSGLIPYSFFKFVKIDSAGQVTWENRAENRRWFQRTSGRPYYFPEYLQVDPIQFRS